MLDEILQPGPMRLLWSLGSAVPLLYALTGWWLRGLLGEPAQALTPLVALAFWGVGAVLSVAWWAVGRWVPPPARELVRWGLSETVAVVGLLALAVGCTWATFGVFLVWAAALHLLAAPPRPQGSP